MENTKTKSALAIALLTGGVIWYGVTHYSDPNIGHTMTRDECVQKRTSDAKGWVKLSGKWGGEAPATISYSVTDQPLVGPFDHVAPGWSEQIKVRVCDLIILHVTPTKGTGKTICYINRLNKSGRDTYSEHEGGGPVQCAIWYEHF